MSAKCYSEKILYSDYRGMEKLKQDSGAFCIVPISVKYYSDSVVIVPIIGYSIV